MDIFYLYIDDYINAGIINGGTKHEKEHNAGLYIVEYAAKKYFHIENSEIEVINNKPEFKFADVHFSISHSHNIAAVCFDFNDVGFDIEIIKNRDWLNIAERMNFKLKENSIEEFYKCWTKYEAEFKLQKQANSIKSMIFKDEKTSVQEYAVSIASYDTAEIKSEFHRISI